MRQARVPCLLGQMTLIALGSNVASAVGTPRDALLSVLALLPDRLGPIETASPMYQTPAFPEGAGPDYVNAVIRARTLLPPEAVLDVLHDIERDHGRVRGRRWADRVLDLDLLAMDDLVLPDPQTQTAWRDIDLDTQQKQTPDRLILPHPRLQDRAFVLVPMADVAPDWRHPVLGLTVAQMLARLPAADQARIVAMD